MKYVIVVTGRDQIAEACIQWPWQHWLLGVCRAQRNWDFGWGLDHIGHCIPLQGMPAICADIILSCA